MTEISRPLIRDLTNLLWPLLETEGERAEWQQKIQPLRARVSAFTPSIEPPATPPPAVLLELRDRLLSQDATPDPDLANATVQTILRHRPRDLAEYRVARIADWTTPWICSTTHAMRTF
jgi:hypothetical protein